MNASARLTAVTLLAAGALGAAIVTQGCSDSTSTGNDKLGAPGNDSGPGNGNDGGPRNDGGSSNESNPNGGDVCTPNTHSTSEDEGCDTCRVQKCCGELKRCFEMEVNEDFPCSKYAVCVSFYTAEECKESENPSPEALEAYSQISACSEKSCATECAKSGGN